MTQEEYELLTSRQGKKELFTFIMDSLDHVNQISARISNDARRMGDEKEGNNHYYRSLAASYAKNFVEELRDSWE